MKCEKERIRLDLYLSEALGLSRSKVQKLIKEKFVLVDGKIASSHDMTKLGSEIEIISDLSFEQDIEPEDISLDIIYEDDDLLIINKASGMVVHPAPGNYTGTLVNALLYRFQLSHQDSIRPGIVHRLDKDTSGLMVVAKNDEIHEKLSDMIAKKEVERVYVALVDGVIPHATGTIEVPIGRDVENRQKMAVTEINSKASRTHFKVLERFSDMTFVECKLDTGRTHQIRVSFSYIGYPVFNDPLYGKRKKTTPFGQFLHSKSIRFLHPRTKEEIYFEVDMPKEMQDKLKELER